MAAPEVQFKEADQPPIRLAKLRQLAQLVTQALNRGDPPLRSRGFLVADLPANAVTGDRAHVTDATAPTFGAVLTGGGAVVTTVFFNGTTWRVG